MGGIAKAKPFDFLGGGGVWIFCLETNLKNTWTNHWIEKTSFVLKKMTKKKSCCL